ncbi:2-C-methyl-D-erythritol 4-phosphate cytidylyltransferase [Posidoniimonas polymericola]|uniref:2-C-methyl-D-erythritol 4-phosphate cytidylyltransferase n=1 Tax=Posidoniimonas polymericola TaxID=2528002 RepID=A0A5C5YQ23_9BACT|nr:2-C-methyl-D-erythritol 4-phosphate cytidylyltransferase [Posidoniimonas polymericola]TWT76973.1 2-C-methyl-D-erythritol 4-phosphate cytidylyltransferase [Posidoniimonas polymericola]
MSSFGVILVAAGGSTRFGDKQYKKPFANLAGRAVWLHSAELFLNRDDVEQLVVVIAEDDREDFDRRFGANRAIMGFDVAIGGQQRADSVAAGLAKIKPSIGFVAVHDAARPCLSAKSVDAVFAEAQRSGAAILAARVSSTLKRATSVDGSPVVEATVSRENLWAAQTPQAFARELLVEAYAQSDAASATDDSQLMERLGRPVSLVENTPLNLKITTKADLKLAEQILKNRPAAKPKVFGHPFADDNLWR